MKRELFYIVLTMFGFSLALSILVLLGVSRDVRKKTSLLTSASKKIGEGYYETVVNLNSEDEFGAIAGALNTMAKEISQSHEKLKSEIDERQRAEEESCRRAKHVIAEPRRWRPSAPWPAGWPMT
ncbi:MAG: hypothetical protein AUJ48_04690 [Deltaproteobacteria bacterium CG1_02_45_11]|nr:MAG: hypothetical protein AUJ48_04690 [Deltaproteobacteria bacterium CG1_02_45_11]